MGKGRWVSGIVVIVALVALAASAAATEIVTISPDQRLTMRGASNLLSGVPQYDWNYGCSPTAGGMLVGYYDSHPSGNWSNLVDGDISTYNALASSTIASPEHITDYWGTPDPYIGAWTPHADNCIADFMHTSRSAEGRSDGGTDYADIPIGLKDFTEWDNPGTVVNEAYYADAWNEDVGWWGTPGDDFTYADFKAEIDAGRPMLFGLMTGYDFNWYGHSVAAYGYQDDMFQIKVPTSDPSEINMTVGGFAVWDTWDTTSSQSEWFGWDYSLVPSITDVNGVEWWPFLGFEGASYNALFDWMITEGVYYHPGSPIPEPCTLVLLGSGLIAVIIRRKRRGRRQSRATDLHVLARKGG